MFNEQILDNPMDDFYRPIKLQVHFKNYVNK